MQRNLILAFHGFLGQGSDWDSVKKEFQGNQQTEVDPWEWLTPDLFSSNSNWLMPYDHFCKAVIKKYETQLLSAKKKIFIGYSLGGRLGLHFLKNYADHFDHFIFVSTHPGLLSEADKELRKASDTEWSIQIIKNTWIQFLKQWNSQVVLKSASSNPVRAEKDFNLTSLQASLKIWSLAEQQDLRDVIKMQQHKIIWVVGDQDTKFLHLAEDLKQKKILLNFSRIFSGHRILFENPKQLAQLLHQLS